MSTDIDARIARMSDRLEDPRTSEEEATELMRRIDYLRGLKTA